MAHTTIEGSFDVSLSSLPAGQEAKHGITFGKMLIHKTYTGELDAVSNGEMFTTITPKKGSAGYIAREQVEGTLNGRSGSFVLQHYGTMSQGEQNLTLEVVPDSGTDELESLSGSMNIEMAEDGKHFYRFEFTL
jgi:hypothetical protein